MYLWLQGKAAAALVAVRGIAIAAEACVNDADVGLGETTPVRQTAGVCCTGRLCIAATL